METLFKQMQPLNECVKCEGGAKHHRAAHGLVIVSPIFHEVCRWHKNDAFPDIWRIVNIPHTGEYLAVMTDGLPKFIVVDGRLGKRLVHHLLQVIQVSGLPVGVPSCIGGEQFVQQEYFFQEGLFDDSRRDERIDGGCANVGE